MYQPRSIELYHIMGILPDILPISGVNKMMKIYLPDGTDIVHTLSPRREDTPDIPHVRLHPTFLVQSSALI